MISIVDPAGEAARLIRSDTKGRGAGGVRPAERAPGRLRAERAVGHGLLPPVRPEVSDLRHLGSEGTGAAW